jgi:hypothetical protein
MKGIDKNSNLFSGNAAPAKWPLTCLANFLGLNKF